MLTIEAGLPATLAPDDGTRARLRRLAADAYAAATGRPFPRPEHPDALYRTIADRVGDRWLVQLHRHWRRPVPRGSPLAELVACVWIDVATEWPEVEVVVDHYAGS